MKVQYCTKKIIQHINSVLMRGKGKEKRRHEKREYAG
jgi:hypothetical protein